MEGKICSLIPQGESRKAKVISAVCYCDGKRRHHFVAETVGIISDQPKGAFGFQFDPIFIPEGASKTYAEMSQTEKLKYSQASKAYEKLQLFLQLKKK